MRKPIIAGNWKMHKTVDEAKSFLKNLEGKVPSQNEVDTVVCAPFIHLPDLVHLKSDVSVDVGAQNMHYEDQGAFTGEVSPEMLASLGVKYVILGHSERREHFNETDETVHLKVHAAFKHKLIPIICVGEHLSDRENKQTKSIVQEQVLKALKDIPAEQVSQSIIAYEPIWAIGTGKSSSAEDANEVISFIRSVIREAFNEQAANHIRIQYGGSVKPENIKEYMAQSDIDGALVGGASLKPDSFVQLLEGSKG